MILNKQPAEKVKKTGDLDVINIWETIQGEGIYTGRPAVFIRLAGCNLMCPLCDTNYTVGRAPMTVGQICKTVKRYQHTLVVITGGEPFRQDISKLVEALLIDSYYVQVETNGTMEPLGVFLSLKREWANLKVVCSPKTPKVHPIMHEVVDAWKYVLRMGEMNPVDGLPMCALGMKGLPCRPTNSSPVYIQPMDEEEPMLNRQNTELAVYSSIRYGHLLCLQIHKLVGLP